MMHDIFIPCKVGNYYLHTKRVLSVEVTPIYVQGALFLYSGKTITLVQSSMILLKDSGVQTQINTIKKMVTSMGKVDEIVTTLSTSAIIFKEMQLPFLGSDALRMVIPFEVESMLPFALDEAIIDFFITHEDNEKKMSTVLVAAVRKEDVQAQYELFEKAEISLQVLLIDVFALYHLYRIALQEVATVVTKPLLPAGSVMDRVLSWKKKLYAMVTRKSTDIKLSDQALILQSFRPKRSEIFIEIGFNSIKVISFKDGMLSGVRIIPFAVSDGLERMSQELSLSQNELAHNLFSSESTTELDSRLSQEFETLFSEISRTISYFQQQEGASFLQPYRMFFAGIYTDKPLFAQLAKKQFGSVVEIVNVSQLLKSLGVVITDKQTLDSSQTKVVATALSIHFEEENNLLQDIANKDDNKLLHMQLLAMFLATMVCIGGIWFRSSQELAKWQSAYNGSKKQFSQSIEQQMGIDLHGEKNPKTMIERAEEVLKRESAVWFAFTKQNETSILEYLQDLSIAIDRVSIGLELKQMHLDYEKVTMVGSVPTFEKLDIFEEELQSLKLLTVTEQPRELSWTIQLQPKNRQKGSI